METNVNYHISCHRKDHPHPKCPWVLYSNLNYYTNIYLDAISSCSRLCKLAIVGVFLCCRIHTSWEMGVFIGSPSPDWLIFKPREPGLFKP